MSELRRSVRSNKGQHPKTADHDYPSLVKRARGSKKNGSRQTAEQRISQPDRSPDGDESDDEEDDDAAVRCVCGATEDLGGRMMIECEGCKVWQHNVCMGIPETPDESLVFYCELCKPDIHRELLDAIGRGEKPWETRISAVDRRKKGKRKTGSVAPTTTAVTAAITTATTTTTATSTAVATPPTPIATVQRSTKPAAPSERDSDESTLKRKHDEADSSMPVEEAKRIKSEHRVAASPIAPTHSRLIDTLIKDLTDAAADTIRAGLFVVPAGATLPAVVHARATLIERGLARLGDNSAFNSQLAAIRHSLRTDPDLVGRLFRGEAQYEDVCGSKVHHFRHDYVDHVGRLVKPEPVIELDGEKSDDDVNGNGTASPRLQSPTPPVDLITEKAIGDGVPLGDVDRAGMVAVVKDPSFAFVRTLLQGSQCSVRVAGRFVGGGDFRTIYSLDRLVSKPIELNGRTAADGGDSYCLELDPGSMDVMVCALDPLPTVYDRSRWEYVFQYYDSKSKWGVVNIATLTDPVRDMYLIPLGPDAPFPQFFSRLRFVNIATHRTTPLLLLVIIAHTRPMSMLSPNGRARTIGSAPISTIPLAHTQLPMAMSTPGLMSATTPQSMRHAVNAVLSATPISATRPFLPTRPGPTTPIGLGVGLPLPSSGSRVLVDGVESNVTTDQPGRVDDGASFPITQSVGRNGENGTVSSESVGQSNGKTNGNGHQRVVSPNGGLSFIPSQQLGSVESQPQSDQSLTTTETVEPDRRSLPRQSLNSLLPQHIPSLPVDDQDGQEMETTAEQSGSTNTSKRDSDSTLSPPNPDHPTRLPDHVGSILGPMASLPVVDQLQSAGVLAEMGDEKLRTLEAVLIAHPELRTDLGRLVTFLQRVDGKSENQVESSGQINLLNGKSRAEGDGSGVDVPVEDADGKVRQSVQSEVVDGDGLD